MNFCKRSYQPILRYLYTETMKRQGEISLHKHFKSYYSEMMDGNYWAGSGLFARKMAAVGTKTSKVPTDFCYGPYSVHSTLNMNINAQHAQTY